VGPVRRTPLTRKTPLRRSGTALRRVALKARPRPREDRTDPRERAHVIVRDGCVAYLMDQTHQCATAWGEPHGPREYAKLTADHVHTHAGGTKGVRAPCGACTPGLPQRGYMTGMCGRLNGGGDAPSKDLRAFQRDRLQRLAAEGRL